MKKFLVNIDNMEDLEIMRQTAGFKTKAQVVRRALELYLVILRATSDGKRLYVGTSPTDVQPLILLVR